jgi:hypothetical protein
MKARESQSAKIKRMSKAIGELYVLVKMLASEVDKLKGKDDTVIDN